MVLHLSDVAVLFVVVMPLIALIGLILTETRREGDMALDRTKELH